jgi:hypothetical protein
MNQRIEARNAPRATLTRLALALVGAAALVPSESIASRPVVSIAAQSTSDRRPPTPGSNTPEVELTTLNTTFIRGNPSTMRGLILRSKRVVEACAVTDATAGNLPGILQMSVRVRIPNQRDAPITVTTQTSRGAGPLDQCVQGALLQLPWPRMPREVSEVRWIYRFRRVT